MRAVMELSKDRPTVLVDGVKILHEDGWCLVVPDPEEALTHIWAEAASEAGALARAQDYARQVRNVLSRLTVYGRWPGAPGKPSPGSLAKGLPLGA